MNRSAKMDTERIPKKFYRYFLKGLAYYTCHKNRACTLADLQAYVYLKSLEKLSEADLTHLSNEVMDQLVSSGIALDRNGYYRLSEILRVKSTKPTAAAHDTELSSGSGMKRMVNFTNNVTVWPIDAVDGIEMANPLPQLEELVSLEQDEVETGTTVDQSSESDSESEEKTNASNTKTPNTTPKKEPKSDSDDDSTVKASEDGSDEDGDVEEFSHKPIKQEPDGESKQPPEGEDDTQTPE